MIRVFLQSGDAYFVTRFSDFVSNNFRDMEFVCFSDLEKACSFYERTPYRFSVLICEEEMTARVSAREDRVMYISDFTSLEDPRHSTINIYQSAHSIIADIKSALALSGKTVQLDTRIAAFASMQGGAGKSTLAYALALAAVRQGKQAMYLNLEELPSVAQFNHYAFKRNVDDLIYKLQEGRDVAPMLLETVERDEYGVLMLPTFHSVEDLLSLKEKDMEKLLKAISDVANVQYIFVDLPSGLNRITEILTHCASTVVHVWNDTLQGREKFARMNRDPWFMKSEVHGVQLHVLNHAGSRDEEPGIDVKFPNSKSLQGGSMVSDVLDKNPMFLNSCMILLERIG